MTFDFIQHMFPKTIKHNLRPAEVILGSLKSDELPQTALLATIDEEGDKRWVPCGTTFVSIKSPYTVLVTAAHNFNGLRGRPMYLVVAGKFPVSLANAHVVKFDECDIALIFLNSNDLAQLFPRCRCISQDSILNVSDSALTAIYQVHGLPQSKNKISLHRPFEQFQIRMSLGAEKELPVNSKINHASSPLCFEASPKNLVSDVGIKDNRLANFYGLSGGPVIRHKIVNDQMMPGNIVGVFLEWHKNCRTAVAMPIAILPLLIQRALS